VTTTPERAPQRRAQILGRTFPLLERQREQFENHFFERLFARDQAIEAFFAGMDLASHRAKLWTALSTIVMSDGSRDAAYTPYIEYLGVKHAVTGVQARHYAIFVEEMADAIAETLGSDWTDEVAEAWTSSLNEIAQATLEAGSWVSGSGPDSAVAG
jgi:nitric oxide dioxygenase